MTITNAQVIEDGLRLIGVVGESQPVTAEQGLLGLRVLNQLLESLAVDGIELGYFAQTSTTDTCPIPDWCQRGVTSLFALASMPFYPSTIATEYLLDDEKNGIAQMRRVYALQKIGPLDMSHLGAGAAGYSSFDFTRGY